MLNLSKNELGIVHQAVSMAQIKGSDAKPIATLLEKVESEMKTTEGKVKEKSSDVANPKYKK